MILLGLENAPSKRTSSKITLFYDNITHVDRGTCSHVCNKIFEISAEFLKNRRVHFK